MAETKPRRSTGPRVTSEKLAISLPSDLAEAARAEARARHAPSLSAFVAQAVEEKLQRDRLDEVLAEIFRDQPMTDEERAWADQHFIR